MVESRTVLHLLPSDDLDYAAAFAALADLQARMRGQGSTPELLLRRGHARFALGNYLAAAFDAERVTREDPACAEALYLKAQCCLAMAAVRSGLAFPGIGVYMPAEGLPSQEHLLALAEKAFAAVLDRNPDDDQAERGLAVARLWRSGTLLRPTLVPA